jgi:GAF domain-containing protein
MPSDLPRVLRRSLGLMRFAREAVDASASSIFLYSDVDRSLHGLVSDWDWTRTSFSLRIDEWPSVAEALAVGEPRRIDAHAARAGETGWFESRGIVSTLCIPLRNGTQPIGVIFFDFAGGAPLGKAAMALLADVGRRCGRALGRAPVVLHPADACWIH